MVQCKESACNDEATGGAGWRYLGWEDSLEEGMATHPSNLVENPMDRGVWHATVHGVTRSGTRLSMHAQVLR